VGCDSNSPGKPQIDWDDPAAKDALVSALVNDANALVRALEGQDLDEQAASAVALLALVAGQDAGPAEGSDGTCGRWRIAREAAPAEVYGRSETLASGKEPRGSLATRIIYVAQSPP
jgi:hypothetical protein